MQIEVKQLVSRVLMRLDESENLLDFSATFDEAGVGLLPLVEEMLVVAAREYLLEAPIPILRDCRHVIGLTAPEQGPGRRILELPAETLRPLSLRMADWSVAVTRFMEGDGEQCSLRRLHADPLRRRCASIPAAAFHSDGRLEIFASSTDVVASLSIVADPQPSGTKMELPRLAVDPILDLTARKIIEIRKFTY